jgi:transposase
VNTTSDSLPDDIDELKAALLAERAARREFEARASGAEAMVAHLKLLIAKMKRDRFGASAGRFRQRSRHSPCSIARGVGIGPR